MTILLMPPPQVLVIGGLTTAVLLAQAGYRVTALEAGTYPGGSAGTFYHQGFCYDADATLAGGFQLGGPHALIVDRLGIEWPVQPAHPAWVVHLPSRQVILTHDHTDVLRQFPDTARFWTEQRCCIVKRRIIRVASILRLRTYASCILMVGERNWEHM